MHRVKKIRHIEEVPLDKEQQQQTRKDILMNYANYKMYQLHFEKVLVRYGILLIF